jgi:hypothetical protein
LKLLVRWFSAVVRAVVCGGFNKAEQNQGEAVPAAVAVVFPHTPYALRGA